VQALVVAPAVHKPAREFVDDDDLAVFDDVVDIALHKAARAHGLVDVVGKRGVLGVGQILHVEKFLGLLNADLRERNGALLLVDDVSRSRTDRLQLLVVGLGEDFAFCTWR
jgi:hypothetical protein